MIPYGRQTIEEDDIEEVVKVLKSDFLTTGPKVAEFERAVDVYKRQIYSRCPLIRGDALRASSQRS